MQQLLIRFFQFGGPDFDQLFQVMPVAAVFLTETGLVERTVDGMKEGREIGDRFDEVVPRAQTQRFHGLFNTVGPGDNDNR